MPFCPVCRDEFEDWVRECPDDKVPLVDELPPLPERRMKDEPLAHIATAPNEPLARMWADVLEEHGIHALLKGINLGGMVYIPSIITPYQLFVLESDKERAEEILAPFTEEFNGGEEN